MARKLALGALMLLAGLFASVAGTLAAELLMFDDPGCVLVPPLERRDRAGLPALARGQQAPLRRIHIRDQAKAGVALASRINATPTFVLVEDGQEVGRIAGYAGQRLLLSDAR